MSELSFFATRIHPDGSETMLLPDVELEGDSPVALDISTACSIKGTLSPHVRWGLANDGRPLMEPMATAIYAARGGHIVAGGIVVDDADQTPSLSIQAIGHAGYLGRVNYSGERYFIETDALDIYRHLWDHAQSFPSGNLRVEVDPRKSGVLMGKEVEEVEFTTGDGEQVAFDAGPVKLAWWLEADLMEPAQKAIEASGHEWTERHSWIGDEGVEIKHEIIFGSPTLGRRRDDLMLEVGTNVALVPVRSRTADNWASEVLVLGSGEGKTRLHASVTRATAGRLRSVFTYADKGLDTVGECRSVAARISRAMDLGEEIASLTLRGMSESLPEIGDEVHVSGVDQSWYGRLDLWVRVTGMTLGRDDLVTCSVVIV